MVSKKNFQLNSRIMPQQRPGVRAAMAPYKKPYKAPIQLFSASQIPDDPGYVDFNSPNLPPISNTTSIINSSSTLTGTSNSPPSATKVQQSQSQQQQQEQQQQQSKKKSNNKSKQKNKQQQNHGIRGGGGGGGGGGGDGGGTGNGHGMNGTKNSNNWSKKMSNMMNGGGGGLRGCNNGMQRGYDNRCDPVRPLRGRGGRMVPGMPRGGMGMQSIGPPPIHGFQPPPMIPPMGAPIGRGPMPPIPPMVKGPGPLAPPPIPPPRGFMHRNGHKMPPIPPPMPPMLMTPRLPRNAIPPAVVPFNGSSGKIKKPNPKLIKKVIKSKSSIKTLKNLVNQYPLDKPWVTNDLKVEYDKKIDIENRLKGNKNDELFAQFKAQRDKFVSLYELAREEYLKKEAAAVKAKDGGKKGNQTKNNTADLINGNENQNVVVVEEKPKP